MRRVRERRAEMCLLLAYLAAILALGGAVSGCGQPSEVATSKYPTSARFGGYLSALRPGMTSYARARSEFLATRTAVGKGRLFQADKHMQKAAVAYSTAATKFAAVTPPDGSLSQIHAAMAEAMAQEAKSAAQFQKVLSGYVFAGAFGSPSTVKKLQKLWDELQSDAQNSSRAGSTWLTEMETVSGVTGVQLPFWLNKMPN